MTKFLNLDEIESKVLRHKSGLDGDCDDFVTPQQVLRLIEIARQFEECADFFDMGHINQELLKPFWLHYFSVCAFDTNQKPLPKYQYTEG